MTHIEPTLLLNVDQILLPRSIDIVAPLTFSLYAGEGLAICGPNGVGKTTLLETIASLLSPKNGTIQLNGTVGYVQAIEGIQTNMTCLENFYIEALLCGKSKKDVTIWLEAYSDLYGLTTYLNKKVNTLSAGMSARLSIGLSMLATPKVLLLDESFNALDTASIDLMQKALLRHKQMGGALIFISHTSSDYSVLCEQVLSLPSGEVTRK
ncbi:MAG: ATP-binding cassette domain-containing protein [Vagococcus sp.]